MATTLAATLRRYCDRQLPRVLTQLDRDPDSPTYGCFDRNFWHYKIRDFPSAILQQGVFALEAVRRGHLTLPGVAPEVIAKWSQAAINNLEWQVQRRGRSVDEYYPYEDSYPAAAFGLYAATRVLRDWQKSNPEWVSPGHEVLKLYPTYHDVDGITPLERLARNLATRTEDQAANQQAAGLAGLALGLPLLGLDIDLDRVRALADRLLATQHEEGWFPEYGGPDFGYLAVTLDALCDYHEATGDERALTAAHRAVDFLVRCVGAAGRLPGPCNSRNTDYVVPYGLARLAQEYPPAHWLLHTLFRDADQPHHFLWATDDRYHCHYVYASCVRALPYLDALPEAPTWVPPRATAWLPGCGYYLHWPADHSWSACIAARKGGLVHVQQALGAPGAPAAPAFVSSFAELVGETGAESAPAAPVRTTASPVGTAAANYGWRIQHPASKRDWTSNWWTAAWAISGDPKTGLVTVMGRCQGTRHQLSAPLKHMALRLLAKAFGRRLIPWLKKKLIFRQRPADGPTFARGITCTETGIIVQDELGDFPGAYAGVSPRQNLRHVASADSFHADELALDSFAMALALDQCQTVVWTCGLADATSDSAAPPPAESP